MNIERMQPADFDAVYRLLTQSFPATERRGAAGQRALFSDSAYRVDILRAPDGGVQALIASWDFDGFVFLEHFAVAPACRIGGIGGLRQGIEPQNTGDHAFHLNLFGLAVAGNRHF